MDQILAKLEIVELDEEDVMIRDPIVCVAGQCYLVQDFGAKTVTDHNMCFYLCLMLMF